MERFDLIFSKGALGSRVFRTITVEAADRRDADVKGRDQATKLLDQGYHHIATRPTAWRN